MTYTTVESRFDATELVSHLSSAHRHKPVVVVSSTKQGPRISPDAVVEQVDGEAEVFLLSNHSMGYLLEELMPLDTHVYGGAARSYPVGTAWMDKTYLSPVRLAHSDEEALKALELIGRDVDKMLTSAAMAPPAPATAPARRVPASKAPVSGTVMMLMDGGAVVKLDTTDLNRMARIDTESFAPRISTDLLMFTGMQVRGVLAGGVLDISPMLHTPAEAADRAEEATIQAAMVLDAKTVALFPGLEIRHRTEGYAPGTVIAVEIELAGRADGKAWRLATAEDVGPDEVSEALPLFRGGDPWITVPEVTPAPEAAPVPGPAAAASPTDPFAAWEIVRTELQNLTDTNRSLADENAELQRAAAASVPVEASPLPGPALGAAELERANHEIARLDRARRDLLEETRRASRDADVMAHENASLVQLVARLREDVRTERERANRARRISRESAETCREDLFADPEEQFRFDVLNEWATRIPASSKAEMPLPDFDLGPDFLASVSGLHGVDRSKIVAVAVEVLTGVAEKSPGREMHSMREGNTALTPPPGTDPGKAWRVSLQVGSASARRMHFWRGAGGRIMFANVGVHDEIIG